MGSLLKAVVFFELGEFRILKIIYTEIRSDRAVPNIAASLPMRPAAGGLLHSELVQLVFERDEAVG